MTKKRENFANPVLEFLGPLEIKKEKKKKRKEKNSHNDLTTNFTTRAMSTGILYQLQWLLMKENYSKNNQT